MYYTMMETHTHHSPICLPILEIRFLDDHYWCNMHGCGIMSATYYNVAIAYMSIYRLITQTEKE